MFWIIYEEVVLYIDTYTVVLYSRIFEYILVKAVYVTQARCLDSGQWILSLTRGWRATVV